MFWIRQTEWKQTSHETALNYVNFFLEIVNYIYILMYRF